MKVYIRMVRRLMSAGMSPARATLAVVGAYKLSMLHMEAIYVAVVS